MNDLVESLRRLGDIRVPDSLYSVAADEIERIEKELAESQAREAALIKAIDKEMVAAHVGVFNKDDDPVKAINALMSWYSDVGEYFIRERLADSQAREAKLREALMKVEGCDSWKESTEMAYEALAMPNNDTALKEYRKQVLLGAANKLASDWQYAHGDPADAIRKMAEE